MPATHGFKREIVQLRAAHLEDAPVFLKQLLRLVVRNGHHAALLFAQCRHYLLPIAFRLSLRKSFCAFCRALMCSSAWARLYLIDCLSFFGPSFMASISARCAR